MNNNKIICFDYETASPDKDEAQIIQIAAVAIDPRRLSITDKFSIWIRPDRSSPGYTDSTIEWHAQQREITVKEMNNIINDGVGVDIGWKNWVNWVDKHNKSKGVSKTPYMAPVAAGYNIRGFDLPITDKYCYKYGPLAIDKRNDQYKPRLFNQVHIIEVMDHMWFWFENINLPKNGLKLTKIAEYMGYPVSDNDQAHDATFDVQMTADILLKLLKFERFLTQPRKVDGISKRRLEMKGCFS